MRIELCIPFAYSIVREMRRHGLSFLQAVARVGGDYVQHYLWIPLFAMIITGKYLWSETLFFMAAYFVVYEAGYIIADNLGKAFEDKKVRKVVYRKVSALTVVAAASMRLLIVFAIVRSLLVPYIFTIALFILHSVFDKRYRLTTFPVFKIIKGIVPYMMLIAMLRADHLLIILAGLFGIAIFETMEYYSRKNFGKIEKGFLEIKNSLMRFIAFMMAIACVTVLFEIHISYAILALALYAASHLVFAGLTEIKTNYLG